MRYLAAASFVVAVFVTVGAAAQPTPASIDVTPTTYCAQSISAGINLSAPAPAAGQVVQLSSTLPAVMSVPASVTVPGGATRSTLTLTCTPMAQAVAITLTATANGTSRTAVVNVLAPVLDTISLKKEANSRNLFGAVMLLGPAPAGGVIVTLSQTHPSLADTPPSVTIPSGSKSANFNVTNVDPVGQPTTLTFTATGLGVTKTANFTLEPPAPKTLLVRANNVFVVEKAVVGGTNEVGQLTLQDIAGGPSGVTVQLVSDNPAAVTLPASVTVAPTQSITDFTFTTQPVAQVTRVNIRPMVGGVAKGTVATVEVRPPTLQSVTATPTTLIGGQSSQGRVTIDANAPTGGLPVAISSSNPSRATSLASTVTIPAGGREAAFSIKSEPSETSSSVTLTATMLGVSRTVNLSVVPEGPSSLTITPDRIVGGLTTQGAVTALVSDDSFVVALTSSDPSVASVPDSVSFSPGNTVKYFTINTTPTAVDKPVTISARTSSKAGKTFTTTSFSVTRTATVTVTRPVPTQLTLSATNVLDSVGTVTGTVTLSRPAPAGMIIDASSSGPVASTASFTANTGALTHSFVIQVHRPPPPSDFGSAIIRVRAGGVEKTVNLTVRRP